jgi:VanZ family protein
MRSLISILAWVWFGFIAFATLSPPADRPELTLTEPALVVLMEHVGAFALLGFLLFFGYPNRHRFVGAFVVCAAITLELLQLFVPGRDARINDALEKVIGAGSGMFAAAWLLSKSAIIERRSNANPDELELWAGLVILVLFAVLLVVVQNM